MPMLGPKFKEKTRPQYRPNSKLVFVGATVYAIAKARQKIAMTMKPTMFKFLEPHLSISMIAQRQAGRPRAFVITPCKAASYNVWEQVPSASLVPVIRIASRIAGVKMLMP